jgi:hypothetical protein
MLVHTNVQEILAEAEHNRIARQAPMRRPSPLATLASRLPWLSVGIGHFAPRAGADDVLSAHLLPDAVLSEVRLKAVPGSS